MKGVDRRKTARKCNAERDRGKGGGREVKRESER